MHYDEYYVGYAPDGTYPYRMDHIPDKSTRG